jgi:eukaryotic-like serine/threonine-protein kinase
MALHKLTLVKERLSTPAGWWRRGGGQDLPPDLLKQAARRLSWTGLVYAGLWGVYLTMHLTGISQGDAAIVPRLAVLSIAMGLLVGALARGRGLVPARLLDFALIFEFVSSATVATAEGWGAFSPHAATWPGLYGMELLERLGLLHMRQLMLGGNSWVCAWIVFFPLLIPNRPRKMLVSSLAAAATVPLSLALSFAVNGVAGSFVGHLGPIVFFASISPFLCAILASIGARVVYQFAAEVRLAREMGSYRLVRPLGQGGMGEVWLAEHRMLARPAAIKLIRVESIEGSSGPASETAQRRFEREAQATASLSSPHAVHLHDYGVTSDGTFYYVMELLDGLDLGSLVERFGPVPPERAVHFLRQACHALGEAHATGLIHRDIKPANLYACRYGRDDDFIKVLDFGLVKAVGAREKTETELTGDRALMGTPAYLAPEMIADTTPVDGRADLYGLGCVAYFLLTGRPVFESHGLMQLIANHLQAVPVPPSRYSANPIPESLERLILQCLEKDPAQRPQSADELAERLAACEIEPPWTPERAKAWWDLNQPKLTDAQPHEVRDALISLDSMSETPAPGASRSSGRSSSRTAGS